ncbi:XRE family transcriptional regulator [Tepidimonas sediminis]|uniref:XRE family transcriptional regulator n=1 Tax=Tepidimonas sediminis TaxID=2588941 RepID=UPI001C8F340D|nr:XRE family transcriptional regulator [Tepidimonas sediminis]
MTRSRLNDLLRGRLSRFSLDALVNQASAAGLFVRIEGLSRFGHAGEVTESRNAA